MDARLQRALEGEQFDVAVDTFAVIEAERKLCPHELVLKARCLQLHPVSNRQFLLDAKNALMMALEIDPLFIPAWIELGWFHLNVENSGVDALPVFERALNLATPLASEALVGLLRSTEEAQSAAAAIRLLEERSVLDGEMLREEYDRLQSRI